MPEKAKENPKGHYIEVTIKANVKRGQIKKFIHHLEQELEVSRDECGEIKEASLDYTHWV